MMFATEQQFYPSTEALASKVYWKAKIEGQLTVLDPTAGNGVLLDKIKLGSSSSYRTKAETFAIEIEQDLRYILQGKGHQVIGSDFWQYSEPVKFDRIIMNPPFNQGAKMVLRAWEFLKDGGILISTLNIATLENQHTKERELLSNLIDQYGESEDLGRPFNDGPRPTDVRAVMITLKKPAVEKSFDFSGANFTHDEIGTEDFREDPLAHTDVIKNLVAKYKTAEAILIERQESQSKLNYYLRGISSGVYVSSDREHEEALSQPVTINSQLSALKSRFWNTIFEKTELRDKATSAFREKFTEFSRQQISMEFSEKNIHEMLALFYLNKEQIMSDCLLEVFDKATKFHEKNIIHTEGWKTNKSYKLSKRIIHPNGVNVCRFFKNLEIDWNRQAFLDDLDKCLCWLSGESMEEIQSTYKAIYLFLRGDGAKDYQQRFESTFFSIRVYKKGIVHLDFKDLYLLDDFNLAVAKGKKWIGADY